MSLSNPTIPTWYSVLGLRPFALTSYLQEARHVPIPKGADYAIDVDRTIQTCRQEGVKLLIFSNPGNPTCLLYTSRCV